MLTKTRIAVVDGQGGGVGKALVEKLRQIHGDKLHIIALGTNSLATSQMLRAGADEGATGENAIVVNAGRVEIILGALGILAADSMLGELTAPMATAIGRSCAQKILVPLNRCGLHVAGLGNAGFAGYVEAAAGAVGEYLTPAIS